MYTTFNRHFQNVNRRKCHLEARNRVGDHHTGIKWVKNIKGKCSKMACLQTYQSFHRRADGGGGNCMVGGGIYGEWIGELTAWAASFLDFSRRLISLSFCARVQHKQQVVRTQSEDRSPWISYAFRIRLRWIVPRRPKKQINSVSTSTVCLY